MSLSVAFQIIGTAAALAGILLIARKHVGCWPVFIASNLIFIAAFVVGRQYVLIAQALAYMAFNIWGWVKWERR